MNIIPKDFLGIGVVFDSILNQHKFYSEKAINHLLEYAEFEERLFKKIFCPQKMNSVLRNNNLSMENISSLA